jgi:uncharacterized OsmC-like protein
LTNVSKTNILNCSFTGCKKKILILFIRKVIAMPKAIDEAAYDKPIIRSKAISAQNSGDLATTVDFGDMGHFTFDEPIPHGGTGLGPTPLQGVLGALCSCKSVTFSRTTEEMDFKYDGIEFDAAFTIDIRGRKGTRGVTPHFKTVKLKARVHTEEDLERLDAVVEETQNRCPVYNLIKDAGVKIDTVWLRAV